jgi:hypothetical protein
MLLAVAVGASRLAAPSGASAGPATSVAGENIIALRPDLSEPSGRGKYRSVAA